MLFDPHTEPSPRKLLFMCQYLWPKFYWSYTDDARILQARHRHTYQVVVCGTSIESIRASMLKYRLEILADLRVTKEKHIKGWTDVEAS